MKAEMTTEEDIDTRAKLTGWLSQYIDARAAENAAKAHKEALGKAFKEWLEENPGEVLYDGELGVQALMQERDAPGRDCDLNAVYDGNKALFEQLLKNGCLKVDEAAIKRAGALVGGIEPYLAPKRRTTALVVKDI